MKIIGLSLGQDINYITHMEVNDNLQVTQVLTTFEPLLSYVIEGQTQFLVDALKKIKGKTKNSRLFITYPSILGHVNCYLEKNINHDLMERIQEGVCSRITFDNKDNVYADAPMLAMQESGVYVTAIYLQKKYADVLMEAALNAGFLFCEGEPEALSIARLIEFDVKKSSNIHYLLEIEADSSMIVCYDPDRGMFSIPLLSFGWNKILNTENGIKNLIQQLTLMDANVFNTFGLICHNADIFIVSKKSEEILAELIKSNLAERIRVLSLPDCLRSKIEPNILKRYLSAVGLGLKSLAEKRNVDETNSGR